MKTLYTMTLTALLAAALTMGAVMYFLNDLFQPYTTGASLIRWAAMAVLVGTGALVYAAAVFATGAYNASMGSNYNRIPRPAAVLVHGGVADLVQRREQPEDLLRYDVLPERLRSVG